MKNKNLDLCNGIEIYGIYKFKTYPEWNILVTNIYKYNEEYNMLDGLAFENNDTFVTKVELQLPLKGKEIGYVYGINADFSLELKNKKE